MRSSRSEWTVALEPQTGLCCIMKECESLNGKTLNSCSFRICLYVKICLLQAFVRSSSVSIQRHYFHSEIQMSRIQLTIFLRYKKCCLFLPRRFSFLHHKQSSVARVRSGIHTTVKAVQRMDGWISRASCGETTMGRTLFHMSGWCCNWIPCFINQITHLGTTGSIISDTEWFEVQWFWEATRLHHCYILDQSRSIVSLSIN